MERGGGRKRTLRGGITEEMPESKKICKQQVLDAYNLLHISLTNFEPYFCNICIYIDYIETTR